MLESAKKLAEIFISFELMMNSHDDEKVDITYQCHWVTDGQVYD
jgi:hypothetical protein